MGKVEQLAAEMGANVEDVRGFLSALSVWTSKGYTIEGAIQKNLETLNTLLSNVSDGFSAEYGPLHDGARALRTLAANMVWETVNAGGAA